MIRLEFKRFWKQFRKHTTEVPVMHRFDQAESFTFFFKSKEGWDYWTQITLQEIFNVADLDEVDRQSILSNFYNIYCVDNLVVEEPLIEFTPQEAEHNEDTEPAIDVYTSSKAVSDEIEPGEDVIDESDDYANFYLQNVNLWKKKVTNKVNEIPVEKMAADITTKAFGEFVRTVLGVVNARPFLRVVRRFVREGVKSGMEAVEQELTMDIGMSSEHYSKVKALEDQQLNGYTINGRMWYGIKGATKELQVRILRQVQEDVQNKVSRKQMTKNIEKIFDGVGKAQAERIARTETTRFINEGKLTSYKKAGIKGHKAYAAVMDDRTSDICRRLHKKYFKKGVPFDEPFVDDKTGKNFDYPPSHVNCRCVIEYRLPPKNEQS